jgi:hypothetical protein
MSTGKTRKPVEVNASGYNGENIKCDNSKAKYLKCGVFQKHATSTNRKHTLYFTL